VVSYITGCDALSWNVTSGLPGVHGATFVLNIWVNPAALNSSTRLFLLPQTANSSSSEGLGSSSSSSSSRQQSAVSRDQEGGLNYFEAIVFIESRRFFSVLNATADYSYMDTPVIGPVPPQGQGGNSSSGGDGGGKVVRRERKPNPRMPVYWQGNLVWGSPPKAGEELVSGSRGGVWGKWQGRIHPVCSLSHNFFFEFVNFSTLYSFNCLSGNKEGWHGAMRSIACFWRMEWLVRYIIMICVNIFEDLYVVLDPVTQGF
jgi:hypothetical protein